MCNQSFCYHLHISFLSPFLSLCHYSGTHPFLLLFRWPNRLSSAHSNYAYYIAGKSVHIHSFPFLWFFCSFPLMPLLVYPKSSSIPEDSCLTAAISQSISQESETHLVGRVSRATPGLLSFGIRVIIERCALCRESSSKSW
ncbi:hypothetical protein BDW75DRAFT_171684 [Aspergillus navahoensis]